MLPSPGSQEFSRVHGIDHCHGGGDTFQTSSFYQIFHFGAMRWYQQRGDQTLHLLSCHTAAVPKHSRQLTPCLNTTGKYKLLQLEESEVFDTSFCLCAVHDTWVQGVSLAGQKPGKGKGCFCARLSSGDSSSLAVLFYFHSQALPVNESLSESGHSSENGQSGEKASAVEVFSLHVPGQNHTQGK